MTRRFLWTSSIILGLLSIGWMSRGLADDSVPAAGESTPAAPAAAPKSDDVAAGQPAKSEEKPKVELPRVSLEVARDRAVIMHDIYNSSMDAMHHRYFHGDRAFVPARAMEDVFADIERMHHSTAKWIGASFTPMSIDHEPETDFEKQASRKIAQGEEFVETIEEGYYRRAGSIRLSAGCISCHSGAFGTFSPSKKFAGLVISIPVTDDARLEQVSVVEK